MKSFQSIKVVTLFLSVDDIIPYVENKKDTIRKKERKKKKKTSELINECSQVANYSSVQFSCSVVSDSLWPRGLKDARLPSPSPAPGASSNSCPLSQWFHPTISSFVIPFFSCLENPINSMKRQITKST